MRSFALRALPFAVLLPCCNAGPSGSHEAAHRSLLGDDLQPSGGATFPPAATTSNLPIDPLSTAPAETAQKPATPEVYSPQPDEGESAIITGDRFRITFNLPMMRPEKKGRGQRRRLYKMRASPTAQV
ncbi:MAG: hypothetical protein IPK82_44530 [Polyangiaceae bacterium]|nr:hypothetical protein [Polyangiaceae bacterium]